MPFTYYQSLSKAEQKIYRQSRAITDIVVPEVNSLRPAVTLLRQGLAAEDKIKVLQASRNIAQAITGQFKIPKVRIKILLNRPHDRSGELHGLYEPADNGHSALITLWMRTAKRHQVVAFKTFFRTLLHELCHHLDYDYFKLDDSFHTEGFYQREASLFKQLLPKSS